MNWDAVGAVGEIIGALAVVVSVIYLAIQIRRQTEQSRLAATRELAGTWSEMLNFATKDKESADLFLKAAPSFNALPNDERLRISSVYLTFMRLYEQQQLHIRNGDIDPKFFESVERSYRTWLSMPGVHEWWTTIRDTFGDEFRVIVDAQIEEAKTTEYDSSYQREREQTS